MCGIAGQMIIGRGADGQVPPASLKAMSDLLLHRGPDAGSIWLSDDQRVGFAHRRLAIQDLSKAGAQPMQSPDGRFVIIFNGEIYDHLDLRQALEQEFGPAAWRGHSDTETLLAGIGQWGLHETLERACGMFALALWDCETRKLSLARDRMGEKPLYLAKLFGGWAFASEPAAFRAAPGFAGIRHPDGIAAQIIYGYVPEGASIFENVEKVAPGEIWELTPERAAVERSRYWELPKVISGQEQGRQSRLRTGAFDTETRALEATLRDVIQSQMISDVPLGSFLSGGIDSSLVTALMQDVSDRTVKSFSIGFEDIGYDESVHAEAVAEHLGTDHTTFHVSEEDALALVPRLPRIYSEPFADSSQIPTILLCERARQDVTVALTGDGGDEVFGGYNRYFFAPAVWSKVAWMPRSLRRKMSIASRFAELAGGGRSSFLRRLARRAGLPASALDRIARLGEVLAGADDIKSVYAALTRTVDDPNPFMVSEVALSSPGFDGIGDLTPAEWMMAMDTLTYLPGDILVKVDRAAMSTSLETRAPLLDRRVVEAAWALPLEMKIHGREGKRILRDILYRHIPKSFFERPKQGFAIPVDRWLRGALRPWGDEMLSVERIGDLGVLKADNVRELWLDHQGGRANHGQKLWTLLMLQAWLAEWGQGNPLEEMGGGSHPSRPVVAAGGG